MHLFGFSRGFGLCPVLIKALRSTYESFAIKLMRVANAGHDDMLSMVLVMILSLFSLDVQYPRIHCRRPHHVLVVCEDVAHNQSIKPRLLVTNMTSVISRKRTETRRDACLVA